MFTFAIRKVHGSAVPTRTPMACSDSIFRKEPTCRCTRKPISTKWPASSMSGHARPWDLKPRQRNLTPVLRRPVELAAQNGQTETDRYLTAFGAKRTCRESRKRFGLTRMTQSGHERPAFAALHGPDLLYLTSNPWVGG